MKFYGDWKLNTYIYGPKDDPYHSSPKWREPYPAAEGALLKALVKTASENQVNFYWAIHPGLDIKWNKQDSLAVLHKFENMYELGIRHFAVFFDDISGEGTKAEKQAGLLNYLQAEFVAKHSDVGNLIMCPTEYNKSWSNLKPQTYLDILGDQLHPAIHIMWTGNSVIHDITKEGQLWVNKRIKRPSFVWWNFPVSDYVRNHLLLGPAMGLDKDAKVDMSGFVSNPMDKPEASKVAIFSIANYSWNLQGYQPMETWKSAIQHVFPEVASAYTLFAEHNTDPGANYHQYRREESWTILPVLKAVKSAIVGQAIQGAASAEKNQLAQTFKDFQQAAQQLLTASNNKRFVAEVSPWLQHFGYLGRAGQEILAAHQSQTVEEAYSHFLALQVARDSMRSIDLHSNRNPYQPGIVTGSRYIKPFVDSVYFQYVGYFKEKGLAVPVSIDLPKASLTTSITQLASLPVEATEALTGQLLKLTPMLEFTKFKPQDYVQIQISSHHQLKQLIFEAEGAKEKLTVEGSTDGKSWKTADLNKSKFIRLRNNTNTEVSVKLKKLELILQ